MRATRSTALAAFALTLLVGCYSSGPGPSPSPSPSLDGQSPSSAPNSTRQPSTTASATRPDELAILGLTREQAATAIKPYGGVIVSEDKSLGIVRARFPVASVEELKEIQQKLREAGVSASIIAVIPTP